MGIIGVSCDPFQRILRPEGTSTLKLLKEVPFFFLLPSLMIFFVHFSCNYFMLGTGYKALSFRCSASECLERRENKDAEVMER
jgi:hypothetical protein